MNIAVLMPVNPLILLSALLCGSIAGWCAGKLIRRRETEPGSWVKPGGSLSPWVHAGVLGTGTLVVALLPPFRDPLNLASILLYLIVIYPLSWIDLRTLTVEPLLVLGGIALRALAVILLEPPAAWPALQGMLLGAGMLYMVGFAYRELRGRDGLGEGDAAVLGFIGAFVGPGGLLPVLLLATVLGLMGGGGVLVLRGKPLDTPVPFVPFLCLAGLVVLVMQHWGGVSPFWPWFGTP